MWKRVSVVVALVLLALATAFVLRPDGPTVKEVGMNRTTTSSDGTTIAYTKLGSGPPLILVDGAFCYRENGPSSQLAPLLAQHFTVFAYDRRGRGASGDAPVYAIEREVDDLRSLVREAGGSAFAVGISSGGALALQAAARGVSLKGLALYEPPFIEEDGHPPFVRHAEEAPGPVGSGGRPRGRCPVFHDRHLRRPETIRRRHADRHAECVEEEPICRAYAPIRPHAARGLVGPARPKHVGHHSDSRLGRRKESSTLERCSGDRRRRTAQRTAYLPAWAGP